MLLFQNIRFFLCITASAADAVVLNPNGVKTLSANGWITFFINGKPVFRNGRTGNSPDFNILDNWVSYSLISVDNNLELAY